MNDDTIGYKTYDTPLGRITVYTKDQPGPKGKKKGTSTMEYADPPPRPIKLRQKYRRQS